MRDVEIADPLPFHYLSGLPVGAQIFFTCVAPYKNL